jgi:hypothetical protein
VSTLPTPTAHGLSEDVTIAVPVPDDGLTLYRLLEHAKPSVGDFEPKLSRSQAQLNHVPELFRCSISHWLQLEQAVGASKRRKCFIARLDVPPHTLVRVALTEKSDTNTGHVDVWGHPAELLRAVAEVIHRQRER